MFKIGGFNVLIIVCVICLLLSQTHIPKNFKNLPHESLLDIINGLLKNNKNKVIQKIIERPVSCCIILFCTIFWIFNNSRGIGYKVGIRYGNIVQDQQYWRLLIAQVTHVETLHLLLNMHSVWEQGIIEKVLGSVYFLKVTVVLLLLSGLIYVGMLHVLIKQAKKKSLAKHIVVGYSCVTFGWDAFLAKKQPYGIKISSKFGIGEIPIVFLPFQSLILVSLIHRRASFLGHISGIFSGYMVATGALDQIISQEFAALLFWIFIGIGLSKSFTVRNKNNRNTSNRMEAQTYDNNENHNDSNNNNNNNNTQRFQAQTHQIRIVNGRIIRSGQPHTQAQRRQVTYISRLRNQEQQQGQTDQPNN